MNLDALQRRLLAIARAQPPDPRVPYAFEKRVMARLRAAGRPDAWTEWAAALWRAAALCVLPVIALGVWTLAQPRGLALEDNLGAALENTVLAAADNPDENW